MKVFTTILKILAALAIIAGIIYVIATYGERIVAWSKKLLNRCCEFFGCKCSCNCDCECDCGAEETVVAEDGDFEG